MIVPQTARHLSSIPTSMRPVIVQSLQHLIEENSSKFIDHIDNHISALLLFLNLSNPPRGRIFLILFHCLFSLIRLC
jgi:hypothetical protein